MSSLLRIDPSMAAVSIAARLTPRPGTGAPTFLIVGAAKCGTTSLWHQLGQHPQIHMHRDKQLNFFSREQTTEFHGPPPLNRDLLPIASWEEYCRAFGGANGKRAIGEASNSYLYNPAAPGRIRELIPDVKLIAVLRHPAERAYARYLQQVRSGREPNLNFFEALQQEEARIAKGWWPDFHYLHVGLYHAQLSRYYGLFPRDQIRIYLQEDMRSGPRRMVRDIFQFLDVDANFSPNLDVQFSVSGLPVNRNLDWVLMKLRALRPMAERILPKDQFEAMLRIASGVHAKNLYKPKLSDEARGWLIERYRDDTLRLQDLIQRDLTAWLK